MQEGEDEEQKRKIVQTHRNTRENRNILVIIYKQKHNAKIYIMLSKKVDVSQASCNFESLTNKLGTLEGNTAER